MDSVNVKLTVYFEDPFWVGVFERVDKKRLSVCKITFGPEPKEYEIQEWIRSHYHQLRFSPAAKTVVKEKKKNPKRMMREAKRQICETGIGTKSQQALKLQQEQMKTERKTKSREQKLAEQERLYELKQQKRKEKHRGR